MSVNSTKFSILIPARNEERLIGRCLESIRVASEPYRGEVETLVVLNRCTDQTGQIARSFVVRIVHDDAKNLAKIRNAGARHATGEILVTIDADSTMSANTLTAIDRALASRRTAGGGVLIRPERLSIGIIASLLVIVPVALYLGVTGGLFWCYREDFEALQGFNEDLLSAEDLDFALRLKAHGKKTNRPFSTLRGGHIVTSCRKFDQFGDWYLVRNPGFVWRLLRGNSRQEANLYYYDVER